MHWKPLVFGWSLFFCFHTCAWAAEPANGNLDLVGFSDPELPVEEESLGSRGVRLVGGTRPVADERTVPMQHQPTRTARSIYKRQPAMKTLDEVDVQDPETLGPDTVHPRMDAMGPGDLDYDKQGYSDEGQYVGDGYDDEYAVEESMHGDYFDSSCSDGSCGDGCCNDDWSLAPGMSFRETMFGPRTGGPWFADMDYLQWWTQGMDVPPLVVRVTGDSANVIFGNQKMLTDDRPGFRVRLGKWLDECQTVGIQGEYLQLNNISDTFYAASNALGRPQLGRPFIEANTGRQFIEDVSIPGQLAGSVLVEARGQFNSAGLRFLYNLCDVDRGCGNYGRLDFLLGYRYMHLGESLRIHEDLTSILPDPNQGSFLIDDRFQTWNNFNGGEFGWLWNRNFGRWNVNTVTKLALGNVNEVVRISGQTVTSGAADPTDNGTRPGGLLTQTTNIGQYSRNQFAMVPEFNVNLGYQITPALRVHVGYSMIYWSRVVRPGDQIDLTVNQNLIPERSFPLNDPTFTGPARPAFSFHDTDFWAQGINAGVHLEF